MAAYVYLIEELSPDSNESGPWTKIGWCAYGNEPKKRRSALAAGNPRELRIAAEYVFEDDNAAARAEKEAKTHFHSFRVQHAGFRADQGEWFKLDWRDFATWGEQNGWIKR